MKFLLDTNVISDFVRGDAVVQSNLRTSAPADVAVSAITVMEIAYGLARNPRKVMITHNVSEFSRVQGLRFLDWRNAAS